MPKFEIDMPAEGANEFRNFVAQKGGVILHESRSLSEVQELWTAQVTTARQMLDQFRNPQEPSLIPNIKIGVITLIHDSLTNTPWAKRRNRQLREDVDWETVESDLGSILARYLIDRLPQYVSLLPGEQVSFRRTGDLRQANVLLPEHIITTINRYGLHDGVLKTSSQVAKETGFSPRSIDNKVASVLYALENHGRINKLLKEEGPVSLY